MLLICEIISGSRPVLNDFTYPSVCDVVAVPPASRTCASCIKRSGRRSDSGISLLARCRNMEPLSSVLTPLRSFSCLVRMASWMHARANLRKSRKT